MKSFLEKMIVEFENSLLLKEFEQDDINVIAGMIDSKIPINVIDFEGNKKGEKKQNFIKKFPFEANNPSEFSKREEVIKYI